MYSLMTIFFPTSSSSFSDEFFFHRDFNNLSKFNSQENQTSQLYSNQPLRYASHCLYVEIENGASVQLKSVLFPLVTNDHLLL